MLLIRDLWIAVVYLINNCINILYTIYKQLHASKTSADLSFFVTGKNITLYLY